MGPQSMSSAVPLCRTTRWRRPRLGGASRWSAALRPPALCHHTLTPSHRHTVTPRYLARHRDAARVPAPAGDVGPDPGQGQRLVQQPRVAGHLLAGQTEEAERAQPVVESDHHQPPPHQQRRAVLRPTAPHQAPPVDPHWTDRLQLQSYVSYCVRYRGRATGRGWTGAGGTLRAG